MQELTYLKKVTDERDQKMCQKKCMVVEKWQVI